MSTRINLDFHIGLLITTDVLFANLYYKDLFNNKHFLKNIKQSKQMRNKLFKNIYTVKLKRLP